MSEEEAGRNRGTKEGKTRERCKRRRRTAKGEKMWQNGNLEREEEGGRNAERKKGRKEDIRSSTYEGEEEKQKTKTG